MKPLVTLSQNDFQALCEQSKVISDHGIYGPKVVLLPNGDYLKVFNPKSGFTKRRFFPKYKEFIKNTEKLRANHVPSVRVTQVFFLAEHQSYAVQYTPLAGMDVRSLAASQTNLMLEKLVPFIVMLHEKGIYFRGIHLGNILRLSDGTYGLIDVADVKFKRGPLSVICRVRNLVHMLKNKDDQPLYQHYGIKAFLNFYAKEAKIFDIRKLWFNLWIKFYSKK